MSKKAMKIRHALFMSVIAMILCCVMLVGTTFAWFTDEVNSTGNIIKSGKLEVELKWSTDNATWADASSVTIFDYEHWEPGYTDVKYLKMSNVGNLAFKYQLNVIPVTPAVAGEVNLADVIDVYCTIVIDPATFSVDRNNLTTTLTKLGTLSELMANPDGADTGILLPADGVKADDVVVPTGVECYTGDVTVCLALKMQETAGNEYQDLSVGDGFRVQLLATQYTYEKDSFNEKYDEDAEYFEGPSAHVRRFSDSERTVGVSLGSASLPVTLDVGYEFTPTETYAESLNSPYKNWVADFVISADKDVALNSIALAGYYAAYCVGWNNGNWVGIVQPDSTEIVTAGTEITLVNLDMVTYDMICQCADPSVNPYGEGADSFSCGLVNLSSANEGTTLTVELRLFNVDENGTRIVDDYLTLGKYQYTLEAPSQSTLDLIAQLNP